MTNTKLSAEDACVLMHTACRKICDSSITSAAYNLIHLINFKPRKWDPWVMFGQLVVDELSVKKANESIGDVLQNARDKLRDRWAEVQESERLEGRDPPLNCRTTLQLLTCIFDCFNDGDWDNFGAYLVEESE